MKSICRLFLLFAILAFIGVTSAAVYLTFNPEAKLFFDRPSPGPDVSPVISLIKMESGAWTNSYGMGSMSGDILEVEMAHKNGDASTLDGVIYFEIECEEGLVNDLGGEGIWDFESLVFEGPNGVLYPCNNNACITRISDTMIQIVPTIETIGFEYGTFVYTNLTIEFLPMAYGNYVLAVYVDTVDNIPNV